MLLYLWVAYECALLAYLYLFGYEKMKKSPIIGALKDLFVCLGLFFFCFAFVAITIPFDGKYRESLLVVAIAPTVGVIYTLRRFRHWSLTKNGERNKNK
jgi:hypothetical protein